MKTLLRGGVLLAAALTLAAPIRAEEDDAKGKGKGKSEAKPNVIQIDLSKLPPDLVKQIMKYSSTKPEKGPAPAPAAKKAPAPAPTVAKKRTDLPPGLANKPADHPGRVNFIKNVLGGKATPTKAQPGQKPKKSKGGDEDSNGDDEE